MSRFHKPHQFVACCKGVVSFFIKEGYGKTEKPMAVTNSHIGQQCYRTGGDWPSGPVTLLCTQPVSRHLNPLA